MRLIGKKLYRVGPLKCFKHGGRSRRVSASEAAARKAEAAAAAKAKQDAIIAEKNRKKAYMKGTFEKDITGAGPQAAMRKRQEGTLDAMAQSRKDIQSGAAARRGAEAGLRAQMAGAGARPGGAASKRALARAGEAGVMGAGAQAAGSAAQAAQMAGREGQMMGGIRGADIGLAKADKTARMKYQQLQLGEQLAREGMKAQVAAAKAGASKCFGGETKISTPSGQVYIKDIKVGDEVLSFDDEGQVSVNIVSKVHEHEPGDIYKLSYWGGEVLVTTNHWILEANNTFLQADKFNTDHCIVDEEGNFRPFKSLEFYELDKTYNITVENNHTYIANGIRVHNGGGGKAEGGEIFKKYAKGGSYPRKNGKIEGAGTETSDSIKARLSDGEFVINAKTVRGIGKALGGKGKQPSRRKGSAYFYALQNKYGDRKAKDTKGLLPIEMSAGGSMDWGTVAKHASTIAKTGVLGKEAKIAGQAVGAGIETQEGVDKAKKEKAKAAEDKEHKQLQRDYWKSQMSKGKPQEPAKKAPSPEAVGVRETKSIMKEAASPVSKPAAPVSKPGAMTQEKADKMLDAQQPQELSKYKKFEEKSKRAVAGKKMGLEGKEIASYAKKEGEYGRGMKDGGKVSKDHPHYKFLKDLEDWQEKRNKSRRGKKVDLDPGRKADKAIRAKKGSIEPMKFAIGSGPKGVEGSLELEKRLNKEQQDAYKAFLKKGMPDSIKKLGLADSEANKMWKKMAIKKAESLKHTGGDTKDLERIGKKQVLKTLRKRHELDSRERGKQKFLKKQRKKHKALIKDTGDGSAAENVFKREKRKFIKGIEDKEKALIKDTGDGSYAEDVEKALRAKEKKGKKELKRMWKHEDKTGRLKAFPGGKQKILERDEAKMSKGHKGARKFLLDQGKVPWDEMTVKERLAANQKAREARGKKEVEKYEKKGFLSKLGDRFSTGEWFGSSKDILAAKRRAKDREQAKREKSGEDFEEKKAAQDKKILKGKLDKIPSGGLGPSIYERKKAKIEAPKPKVAPKTEAPKTKTPEVKPKKGELTSKDKWGMGIAAGSALLKGIAEAKARKEERKRQREAEIRRAGQSAGRSLSDFGRGVMAMDTRLKHGGKVSFKDVLKAKKKMGY